MKKDNVEYAVCVNREEECIKQIASMSGKCGEHLTWVYDEQQKLLNIEGSGPMQFDQMPWEEWKDQIEMVFLAACSFVCANAFRDCKNLRCVLVFEDHLKEIGPSAFEGCCSLVKFDIMGGELQKVADCAFRNCVHLAQWNADVQSVGVRAFENCTELAFMDVCIGTEEIGEYAFANCKSLTQLPMYDESQGWFCLTRVGLEAGYKLSVIPEGAFAGCENIRKLTIPETIQKIRSGAFARCKNLKEIMLCAATEFDPEEFFQKPLIVDSFGSCGDDSQGGYARWILKDGILRFTGNGVVADDPFVDDPDCPGSPPWDALSVHTIIIEEGCTSIGESTFHGHINLKNVQIPQSVAEIGREAFHYCTKLESLVIPDSVQKIGPNAFLMVPHVIYHGPDQSEVNWGR